MSDCYVGEIRIFGGNFVPEGWALCDGSALPIIGNDALYALLGTTYGGNGSSTFNLPDLRGRVPLHMGQGPGLSNRVIGNTFGTETVTLQTPHMPAHSHAINVGGDATTGAPAGNNLYLGNSVGFNLYSSATNPDSLMSTAAVGQAGPTAAIPHNNMMPGLCINFIIALTGDFPQQP